MSISITQWNHFNPDKLQFGPVKKDSATGYRFPVLYDNKSFYLQIPLMKTHFGIQDGFNPGQFNVSLTMDNPNFQTTWKQLDNAVKEAVIMKSVELGLGDPNGPMRPNILQAIALMETSKAKPRRYPKGHRMEGFVVQNYPPTLEVPLNPNTVTFFDETGQPVSAEQVVGKCQLKGLIRITHVYKNGSRFGLVIKGEQFIVVPPVIDNHGLPTAVCLL